MSPIRSVEDLLAAISGGLNPKFTFFWGDTASPDGRVTKSCFSQWWSAPFTIDGAIYPTAEHFMMAGKARLFGDDAALARILAAKHPKQAKDEGRSVLGFDETTWVRERFALVVAGNEAKFSQHSALRDFLMRTGDRVLVEASPQDRIWGIGLAQSDERAEKPAQWRGLNLLGFALMEVRAHLR